MLAAEAGARGMGRSPSMAGHTTGARTALAVAWRALWVSRLVVWAAGVAGVALLGRVDRWPGFDRGGWSTGFGAAGDLLLSPAVRWDSVWLLEIAAGGYADDPARTAFFPLYPLMVRAVAAPARLLGAGQDALTLAGIAVSLAALLAGLWVVHRLCELELDRRAAGLAVVLVAFFPTAWAFSAVYTESLFLALSAGAIYAGRLGRWRWAGALGALAAATRSTGVLLMVPLGLLYLYGPRADAVPRTDGRARRLAPRFALRGDAAWLGLVVLGPAAYLALLALTTPDPWAPLGAGAHWHRQLTFPFGGAIDGAVAAFAGAVQLLSASRSPVRFPPAGGDPFLVAAHNLSDFAYLVIAVVALVGALRRLAPAYGAWALCALAVPLSYPVGPQPLASLPRYLAVLFPLHMWAAAWAAGRRRRFVLVGVSVLALVEGSAAFATWHWVA